MPPALDRLLASPSALRLLRSIVNAPAFPATCSTTATNCCPSVAVHRSFSHDAKPPLKKPKWKRFKDVEKKVDVRDQVRRALQGDDDIAAVQHEYDTARLAAVVVQQERLHGAKGLVTCWTNIRHRGYRLPTDESPDAELLWGAFARHYLLAFDIIEHAAQLLRETGKTYPLLYDLVMGYWLPRDAKKALGYHHAILAELSLNKLPLRRLARLGRSTFKPAAWEALMEIYANSNEQDLYDDVVLPLIEKRDVARARQWHALCTFRNDMPSESAAFHPVVQLFTAEASVISKPELHFETKNTPDKTPKDSYRYNQALLRRLLGRDTAPVRFEDAFCARMFATRTFPPASIIQGLAMVGVNEIGPQAVLAMATRTLPVQELPDRFEDLRAAGIALQGCVFSLALEKFAMEHNWQLVHSMIDSDQHPDVFGDAQVQRDLLEYYLDQGDHVQAQRTLAILTLFHNDSTQESWNLLLQVNIKRTGPQHVMEVLRDMRIRGVMLTPESIMAIKKLLRRRQIGRKPAATHSRRFDDLRFVTRVFIMILESGLGVISPPQWREIIRRFGMLGRFRELRRLLLWLLCWYAPRSSLQFATLPKSPFLDSATTKLRAAHPEQSHYFYFSSKVTQRETPLHPVRQLFGPSLQQAIIVWGFRAGILPNAHWEQSIFGPTLGKKHYRRRLLQHKILKRQEWSIGLRTLVQLRDLGVFVHYHTVLKALQMQLVVMFGWGRSNKRENRIVEAANTLPFATYVHEVNKIWGSPLLTEPQRFGNGMIHDHMWHPRMRRKTNRRTCIHLAEILGPRWQDRTTDAMGDEAAARAGGVASLEELQKQQAKTKALQDSAALGEGVAALEELQKQSAMQAKVTKAQESIAIGQGTAPDSGVDSLSPPKTDNRSLASSTDASVSSAESSLPLKK